MAALKQPASRSTTPSSQTTTANPTTSGNPKPASSGPTLAKPQSIARGAERGTQPTIEAIQSRAYELFVQRGMEHGSAEQDWAQAEAELRGENK